MAIDLSEVKKLKELTGVGLSDAKAALEEADGDFDKALEAMRKKGLTKAEKKGDREALEGLVEAYTHSGRIGALVEVNCETDFVAKTEEFKALAHDLAMHVAAAAPRYVRAEDVPAETLEAKQKEFKDKALADGKPADMVDKIIGGQVNKYFAEQTLLEQPFIKNPDQTVGDLVKEAVAKLGENIVVRQAKRIELGVSE